MSETETLERPTAKAVGAKILKAIMAIIAWHAVEQAFRAGGRYSRDNHHAEVWSALRPLTPTERNAAVTKACLKVTDPEYVRSCWWDWQEPLAKDAPYPWLALGLAGCYAPGTSIPDARPWLYFHRIADGGVFLDKRTCLQQNPELAFRSPMNCGYMWSATRGTHRRTPDAKGGIGPLDWVNDGVWIAWWLEHGAQIHLKQDGVITINCRRYRADLGPEAMPKGWWTTLEDLSLDVRTCPDAGFDTIEAKALAS